MATRKPKRFEEGGITEGENTNIDDDVRSRAMKFVRDREENPGMYEAEPEAPKAVAKPKAKPVAAKPAAPAKAEPAPKKPNILEEAKETARRRYAASQAVAPKRAAPGRFAGKGPGLGALSGMKSGGSVKGWGQARGARKAKVY